MKLNLTSDEYMAMHDELHAGIKFLWHLQEGKAADSYWDKLIAALQSGLVKFEKGYEAERQDESLGRWSGKQGWLATCCSPREFSDGCSK